MLLAGNRLRAPGLAAVTEPLGVVGQTRGFPETWFAGSEGREKNMETTLTGYIGTTIGIHSFIPS